MRLWKKFVWAGNNDFPSSLSPNWRYVWGKLGDARSDCRRNPWAIAAEPQIIWHVQINRSALCYSLPLIVKTQSWFETQAELQQGPGPKARGSTARLSGWKHTDTQGWDSLFHTEKGADRRFATRRQEWRWRWRWRYAQTSKNWMGRPPRQHFIPTPPCWAPEQERYHTAPPLLLRHQFNWFLTPVRSPPSCIYRYLQQTPAN